VTAAEWRTSCRPVHLLDFIDGRLSVRQSRLIAIASCRTIPTATLGALGEHWLATADKLAEQPEVKLTPAAVRKWMRALPTDWEDRLAHPSLQAVYFQVGCGDPRTTMLNVGYVRGTTGPNYDLVDEEFADVVREVVGDPFLPTSADPSWLTSTVVALARTMYETRDFTGMPILADALQDAGCDNEDILDHCRKARPHARGCWVVDLVLGKE
jgi:hypothetical protein